MTLWNISLWALVLDQLSKALIVRQFRLGDSIPVIQDYFYFTYVLNPGAAFGFMSNTQSVIRVPFFIAITIVAGLFVYAYQRFIPYEKKWIRFALGLIWGGAMGNFIDRVFHGRVIDFIDVSHIAFPFGFRFSWVFNLADSCITVGLTILILGYLFGKPTTPVERS
jgi:signal peptidase II